MTIFTKASITIVNMALFCPPGVYAACLNDQDYKYVDGDKKRSCSNIRNRESRRQTLCQLSEVRDACPQSCGICCDDNPDYEFPMELFPDEMRPCSWISKNVNRIETRQTNYCKDYDRANRTTIRNMCPKACDFCFELVDVAPTEAPTTAAPTEPPTTASPTTAAPTEAPTTASPTTASPTTATPTTAAPTTAAPTTAAPTTAAPTTAAPTTAAPTTAAPTEAPTTAAPTEAPTTASPTTAAPTDTPTTGAPTPECMDDPGFTFILNVGTEVYCEWITRNVDKIEHRMAYCEKPEVATGCPQTCTGCVCEDDTDFEFELLNIPGEMRGCDWITKNVLKAAARQENYCDDIGESCPSACDLC